jgi:hypothetical protein
MIPVGFYISNGLTYLGAKVLGGIGSFTTQAYLISLCLIPLTLAAQLVGIIPCVGGLVSLAVSIYLLILQIRVVKVSHQLTTGRSAVAVLWPVALVLFCGCCAAIASLATMGPVIGEIFSNIQP